MNPWKCSLSMVLNCVNDWRAFLAFHSHLPGSSSINEKILAKHDYDLSKGPIFLNQTSSIRKWRVELTYYVWLVCIILIIFEVGHQHWAIPFSVLAFPSLNATTITITITIVFTPRRNAISIRIAKKQTEERCKDKRHSHLDCALTSLEEPLLKTAEIIRGSSFYQQKWSSLDIFDICNFLICSLCSCIVSIS